MTQQWEYRVIELHDRWNAESQLSHFGKEGWELTAVWRDDLILKRPLPPRCEATSYTMTIKGAKNHMAEFNVNVENEIVEFQFTNSAGAPVTGPLDSVTGTPVAPEATSDTPSVLTIADSIPGSVPGSWTAALVAVGPGSANVSPVPLVNSDGSPVNETEGPNAGQPFAEPGSVAVQVNPDDTPTGFSMSLGTSS